MTNSGHLRQHSYRGFASCWIPFAVCYLVVFSLPASAQKLLHSSSDEISEVTLLPSDDAVLATEENKKDLPCTVTSVKPQLGFDLRFHAGFDILIPLKELAGSGQTLTVLFAVTPDSAKDAPRYFSQRFAVPEIADDAGGKVLLQGGFDVGEGAYHVRWMMRDHLERVCSSGWDINATLVGKEQDIRTTITRNAIEAADVEFFKPEPPIARTPDPEPLKVKVLINYAPQQSAAAAMAPIDTSALTSILRSIAREPRIMKFSVVAFNMNDQKVVYRSDDLDQINFPDLGRALGSLKLGMVDYKHLSDPHSPTDFLTHLVQDELAGNPADAVIFAGPKVMLDQAITQDSLNGLGSIGYPVFYMNYILQPTETPWRDAIGSVVKRLKGFEYTIAKPRDLWNAWTDIMSHISLSHVSKVKLASSEPSSSH